MSGFELEFGVVELFGEVLNLGFEGRCVFSFELTKAVRVSVLDLFDGSLGLSAESLQFLGVLFSGFVLEGKKSTNLIEILGWKIIP